MVTIKIDGNKLMKKAFVSVIILIASLQQALKGH